MITHNLSRRGFILGATSLLATPAIVRIENIMPIRDYSKLSLTEAADYAIMRGGGLIWWYAVDVISWDGNVGKIVRAVQKRAVSREELQIGSMSIQSNPIQSNPKIIVDDPKAFIV